jgi:DNA polymerase III subunit gamma/tau
VSAIYQRARPIHWDEVVGQEQVKDVLRAALEAGRIGHAYLFSGPRGVGKTTTARLIAMSANCVSDGKKPCGVCESCLSVRSGNHPDVLEIDAASNNSVEDVRDLRGKVDLSPMRGGKKIYILDEAHMMSRAAFNALLKTLEEPPEHVIFILATTEPEKILPTILSRCQHFRFRRLTAPEIAGKLTGLVTQEGAQAEPEALNLIGRLADGAMRDGESLLERMLAAGQAITLQGVEAALGLPPSERLKTMTQALIELDAGPLLSGAAQLYWDGYAARTVVEGLVAALSEALHAELGLDGAKPTGADIPRLLRLQAALDAQESRFSRGADQLSLELALTHALIAGEGGQAAPSQGQAPQPRAAQAAGLSPDDAARLSRLEREVSALKAAGPVSVQARGPALHQNVQDEIPAAPPATQARAVAVPTQAAAPSGGDWADVISLAKMQMRAFLKPARMHAEAGYASLSYDARGKFHAKQVYDKFDEVGALVSRVFGPVTFELISPELNKKQKLGGPDGSGGGTPASQPEPTPPAAPQAAAPAPSPTPHTPLPTSPAPDDLPDFSPTRRAPKAAAPLPDPLPQVPDAVSPPHLSPDDAAAAPLPDDPAPMQRHAADPVDAPPDDLPPFNPTPANTRTRELYIPLEPISQEPNWDDLGGELKTGPVARPGSPAPSGGMEMLETRPAETFAPPPPPRQSAPPKAAPVPVGDVRSHPNYQEVTRLFSGRVKELGKVKKPLTEASEPGEEDVVDEIDGSAEA